MKNLMYACLFILTTSVGFAQTDDVKGNTVSGKEVAPVWPGCEGIATAQKKCFNQKLAQHIQKNFKFPEGYKASDKGSRVIVSFVINAEGKPEILNVTGGRKILQDEAKRNILALPKMKPGSMNGKPAPIKYKVPFTF